jgi:hypothetical protein
MRILLIANFFPPAHVIAAHRIYSFAKYLPEFGIDITVMTPKRSGKLDLDTSNIEIIHTHTDSNAVNKFVKKKNRIRNLLKYSGIRSIKYYLTSQFFREAKKVIDQKIISEFDAVLASYGNEDALRISYYINKKYSLPLIIDYRDLWFDNLYMNWTPLDKAFIYLLEKKIIAKAFLVTTVSKSLSKQLTKRYNVNPHVIYNGYFDFIKDYPAFAKTKENKITFCYCGSLYGGIQPLETFFPLLVKNQNYFLNIAVLDEIDQKLVMDLVRQFNVKNKVRLYYNLRYEEAIALEKQADYLLFLNRLDGLAKGVLTGKIFEYIALKKYIVGIGHKDDEAGEIINEYNLGCYCSDSEELDKKIKTVLENKAPQKLDTSFFDRKEQANILAKLIKDNLDAD